MNDPWEVRVILLVLFRMCECLCGYVSGLLNVTLSLSVGDGDGKGLLLLFRAMLACKAAACGGKYV
jgi:hypothetical protein